MSFERDGDLRYVGQGDQLKVLFPSGVIRQKELDETLEPIRRGAQSANTRIFRCQSDQIVNVRVVGMGHMPKIANLTDRKARR